MPIRDWKAALNRFTHNRSFASAFGQQLERPVVSRQLPFVKVNHSAVTLRLLPFNETVELQSDSFGIVPHDPVSLNLGDWNGCRKLRHLAARPP
jgi:hypothetical protein